MASRNNFYRRSQLLLLLCCTAFVSSCSRVEVRTTDLTPAQRLGVDTPEELLLDIGLQVFEPDLEDTPNDQIIFTSVRKSESVWVAQQLRKTLEYSNAWGVVRIVPDSEIFTDIRVQGKIVQSDGETLTLNVVAEDMSGREWLNKEYSQVISRYSYDPSQADREPFQGIYNEISDDLLEVLRNTTLDYREDLRAISTIRFAQSFAPEAFGQFLTSDENGNYVIDRLPAENDPMLERVQEIQLRDQIFVDVLQDYYVGFADQMDDPYREWRAQSYTETQIIRELESSARARRVGGWLSILGGVAALFDESGTTRLGGSVAIYAGVEAIQSSFQKRDEAALHIETLSEIGQSIEAELEPSVIELQDRTVTLTGTVRDQYDDWRGILREMYYLETGFTPPQQDQESQGDLL